jgi:hypothetical protein
MFLFLGALFVSCLQSIFVARCMCNSPFFVQTPSGFYHFLFALTQKETKKSRQTLSSAALPCLRLPKCNGVLIYFLASCVMVYHNSIVPLLLLLTPFLQALNFRFKSACKQRAVINRA